MASEYWSSFASFLATFFFLRSLLFELLPPSLLCLLKTTLSDSLGLFCSSEMSFVVEEFDYHGYSDTFDAALRYLSDKSIETAAVVKVSDSSNSRGYSFFIDTNQTFHDELDGVRVRWSFRVRDSVALGRAGTNRVRCLELFFPRAINDQVRHVYFPKILSIGSLQETLQRSRKLYSNSSTGERGSLWSSVTFDHPSTFDTLAIDPQVKDSIIRDLRCFTSKQEYYRKVGRTWKRGYLVFGPPGTGKTSLVAAMANFLDFDVYDLELSAVTSNAQLRRLLLETRKRSLIVIEDIDRSVLPIGCNAHHNHVDNPYNHHHLQMEELEEDHAVDVETKRFSSVGGGIDQLSLSGILNFMDGLWSCCGQERLMVVTTNNKDKLDPALLRPGRLDVHINLSYCGVHALRTLVKNYLFQKLQQQYLQEDGDSKAAAAEEVEWDEVEQMLVKVNVTPATVAEVLIGSDSPETARSKLIQLIASVGGGTC